MSSVAIAVEDLGKRYRIGRAAERHDTVRGAIVAAARRPLQNLRNLRNLSAFRDAEADDVVWAVRDIDFEVKHGEALGIIGRNGAGKSTLLKLLSRITEPSTGRIMLDGRVGALLEVGTGFHQELTGRENVFLNGSILGMDRQHIDRKFDEIVAFAGVERFIDTPVKRYSSGMYLRLAFAVAAHLEPEILVVDEVLAVGDVEFQKKCIGKMGEVAGEGRTVLFVSHNMAAVESLCTRAILLANGTLVSEGRPAEIVADYMTRTIQGGIGQEDLSSHTGRRKGSEPVMKEVTLFSGGGDPVSVIPMGADLSVRVRFDGLARFLRPSFGVSIKTAHGMPVFGVSNRYMSHDGREDEPVRSGSITCSVGRVPLMPGTYLLDLYFGDLDIVSQDLDVIHDAISFEVLPADVFGTGKLMSSEAGPVFWPAAWELTREPILAGQRP